jgi:outer membrane immunogenic protein
MKKFLLATSALVVIASAHAAHAADSAAAPRLSTKSPPIVPQAIYNWTGCYIGVHAGGGILGDTFVAIDGFNLNEKTIAGGGEVAGAQLGCNYQTGMAVVGLEGDAAWSNMAIRFTHTNQLFMAQDSDRNRWSADIAARGGIAFEHALLFGKAGVAAGRFNLFNSDTPGNFFQGNTTLTGLLLGLAIEYAFAPNWSAKLEYNHVGYLSRTVALGPENTSESATTNIVKGGINYKFFGPSAVVVAKD